MSKKSRKRNRRLLKTALLLGGLGLAARNKRNAAIDKGIQSAEDDKGSAMVSKTIMDNMPKKKEPKKKKSVYDDPIMTGGKGVKQGFKTTSANVQKDLIDPPGLLSQGKIKFDEPIISMKTPEVKFGQVKDKDSGEIKTLSPWKNSGLSLGVSKRKKDMDTYKGYATKTGNSRGDFGLTKKPQKKDYFGATIFPKSQAADNYAADIREWSGANQYKSGGRVKLAKRGLGRAFTKSKR